MALVTATITEKLSRAFPGQQAVLIAETLVELHDEVVKIKDFSELKEIVQQIAQTQKRTEHEIVELTQAQKQTERRFGTLEATMERLAQAQERTEHRMERLAQVQERNDHRVESLQEAIEQLTEVQKKTEVTVQTLIVDQKDLRDELGELTMMLAYIFEDKAFIYLPHLLEEWHGIIVQGKLTRTFVADNLGRKLLVNIYGQALQDGKPVTIIGESKNRLSAGDVDEFYRHRVERFNKVFPSMVPVLVTHMTDNSEVEAYTRSRGCLLFYSYDLQ